MMSFLSTVITSRFPSTNNQLRNSSNLRQHATIHDGRVIVQPVQGRQSSFDADLRVAEGPVSQMVITHNAAYQANDLDAYDYDCDDISTTKAVLMAILFSYRSDVLSKLSNDIIEMTDTCHDPKPTITEEDGTTRKKTYAELSASEKLQADCDYKATNIVL
nr:hypothetical protein [Tanacetum cinerariifolium]